MRLVALNRRICTIVFRGVERIYYKMLVAQKYRQKNMDILRLRYFDDMNRFKAHSFYKAGGIFNPKVSFHDPENLSAIITMEYHRLEKGLSLSNRKDGSSQDVIPRLISAIELQLSTSGHSPEGAVGIKCLELYFKETPQELLKPETIIALDLYHSVKSKYHEYISTNLHGGYKVLSASDIISLRNKDNESFLTSRHSIRNYQQKEVETETIEDVIRIALSTPSVCNRQAWHVYAITDRLEIKGALAFQNGNRGFTDLIPLLFVVTSDLRRFVSVEERNQGWIDGGLFSMTLMLALHAKGIGSCPLNWSATRENDLGLRKCLNIPDHEFVIMLISAGYLPDEVRFTASQRRDVADVLTML